MTKTEYVIDSFAWIEYFRGSRKGVQAAPYIEGGGGFTPIVVIAELSAYYVRENLTSFEQDLHFIESTTSLVELSFDVAKQAGKVRQDMRRTRANFGLMDAIIYETALSLKAFVVSGDPHFEGLSNVIFLNE